MTTKEITYNTFEEAIRVSFKEDLHIFDFYDPNVKVGTVKDIVNDITRKVSHFAGAKLRGVYEGTELIGYFVYQGRILISFSLAIKYRVRKYLRDFFNLINKELKKDFVVYLWKRNVRAIKWLQKNGLDAFEYADDMVKLCCPVKETNHSLN